MRKKGSQTTHTTQVPSWTKKPWVAYTLAFGIIGAIVLITTHAATGNYFFDVADGTPANGATKVALANTASGSAIKFGAPVSGGDAGNGGNDTSCVFGMADKPVQQAFCDGFDTAYTGTKTQTGDLDPELFGVSRIGSFDFNAQKNSLTINHNGCGPAGTSGNPHTQNPPESTFFGPASPPPGDSRICNGVWVESMNDGGQNGNIDMYPKQPFDWNGRTGTVVFDVTNDTTGSHGTWPEFLITDTPIPGATVNGSSEAYNQIGFTMDGCSGGPDSYTSFKWCVGSVEMVKNGTHVGLDHTYENEVNDGCLAGHGYDCRAAGAVTTKNHVEVRISATTLDVYATDPFSGTLDLTKTPLKRISHTDITGGLGFSNGLVWMNHKGYNAHKSNLADTGPQFDHSFGWDNLGFDGPKTYRDWGYDVPYQTGAGPTSQTGTATVVIGYATGSSTTFSLPGVDWKHTPSKIRVVMNAYGPGSHLKVSLNGHTAVSELHGRIAEQVQQARITEFVLPATDAVKGTNSLTITSDQSDTWVTNISVIMVDAASVP